MDVHKDLSNLFAVLLGKTSATYMKLIADHNAIMHSKTHVSRVDMNNMTS